MKIIKKILATVLVVCVLVTNMQGFTVEATEAIEGSWGVFEVKVSPITELVAGAQFRMDVEITNTSDMDFDSLRFINAWYHEDNEAPGMAIGILEDANHKGVEIEQQAPVNIAFAKGESKQFELGGSVPNSWNQNSYIAIVVSGQVDNVNYYGQGGAPESAYPTSERAFEVSIDGPETAVSGEEIVLDVQVKNESERELTLTTFEAYYCQVDQEGYFIEETLFGTIYDNTGEITSDRITNITFAAGETKEFQLKGILPESWNESCLIYITVESAIGNKRFTSSSESFQTREPETDEDTGYEIKEEKVEGNLEASVKVDGNITLPGDVIFVADDVTKTIDTEEKTKLEKAIDSKVLKSVTDEHKIAAVLDLKLILRDEDKEIKYEPDGAVKVTVQVPKNVLEAYENIILLHVKDDGTIEVVPFELGEGNKATFKTDGFSYYVFVGTEKILVDNNTESGNVTQTTPPKTQEPTTQAPKTGDSSLVVLWVIAMLCALTGIIVVTGNKKRYYR